MSKDKLKNWDIRYFLVSFILMIIIFSIITYIIINNRIDERYGFFEKQSENIAYSYSQAFIYAHDAQTTINGVLNDKLITVSKAISMIDYNADVEILAELAEELNLDEISLFNNKGEVVFSNYPDYIGRQLYQGHPMYDFMTSDDNTMVEEIRKDVVSGVYKKYAYVKNRDGSIIQIGDLAENVHNLLEQFEFQKLVNTIVEKNEIVYVSFLDNNYEGFTSSTLEDADSILIDEDFRERIANNNHSLEKIELKEHNLIQTSVPISHNGEKHGTLNISWLNSDIAMEINRVIRDGFIQVFTVIIFMAGVLYYAYRKNKANIETAFYDKLTGLPNDNYLVDYLEELLDNLDGKKAIMLINTKNFKTFNMTYGFMYGDLVIAQIAEKLKAVIKSEDRLFRFNADRFILVVNSYKKREELNELAEKVLKVFNAESIAISDNQYVNLEFGIVEIKKSHNTVDRLLQNATLALSYIDSNINTPVRFYEDVMEDIVRREDKIEKKLRAIIKNKCDESFYLCYQPKVDAVDKRIIGFEALARLNLEGMGNISPLEFIDMAEKRQLIYDLGKIILYKSCEFISGVHSKGYKDISLSINISGLQLLRNEFVEDVIEIANFYKVDPKFLEFEITESVLLENYEIINQKLKNIEELGISISIDDFGTGFSSLSRLRELNADVLKIDKCFIDGINEIDESKLITSDIISMAHKMGLKVVAEGVETQKQMDYLEKNHCDIIQGYFISKPLSEEKAIEKLGKKTL